VSKTVHVDRREADVAGPLRTFVERLGANMGVTVGSYPFFTEGGGYGTNLFVRGEMESVVDMVAARLCALFCGEEEEAAASKL
jgi:hypothetical protein